MSRLNEIVREVMSGPIHATVGDAVDAVARAVAEDAIDTLDGILDDPMPPAERSTIAGIRAGFRARYGYAAERGEGRAE